MGIMLSSPKFKYKILIAVISLIVLIIGVVFTKLTVRDEVSLTEEERICERIDFWTLYDNPIERIGIKLFGGTSVISKIDGGFHIKAYTLFRIPVGESIVGCGDMSSYKIAKSLGETVTIQGLGTYKKESVENGTKSYQSDKLDVSFDYPEKYLLFEIQGEGAGGKEYYVVTLIPDSEFMRNAITGTLEGDTEWPASIHFSFYQEPNLSVSLEQWVRTNQLQSNFDPSDPAQDAVLTPTTVAGIPAVQYTVGGLYWMNTIALTYDEWVVLATVDSFTPEGDEKADDFKTILESLRVDTKNKSFGGNSNQNKNTYTNSAHGFSFSYPPDWHEGNNNRDEFFQLYNYDLSKADGGSKWPSGHNKIEAGITSNNTYGTSSDYPEANRTEAVVVISGREAKQIDVELTGGNQIRTYAVPLNNGTDKLLLMSIYGDPINFFVLDEVMKNLRFQ